MNSAAHKLRVRAHARVPNAGTEWTSMGIATAGRAVFVYNDLAVWASEPCCGAYEPRMLVSRYVPCFSRGVTPRLTRMVGTRGMLVRDRLEEALTAADPTLDPLVAIVAAEELRATFEQDWASMAAALRRPTGEADWTVFG